MAVSNRKLRSKNRRNHDDAGVRDDERVRDHGTDEEESEEGEDQEEIVDENYETPLEDDDFIADEEDSDAQLVADEVLTPKEQDARSLAIRRAIEQRMEQKKLDEDLDYLDLDLET
ncbi:MAG: hypothetical protein O7F71_21365 [Gammaproteobacteria bacterium]|nr:hypothetical protein [Gammaproteobacteria bacterium]